MISRNELAALCQEMQTAGHVPIIRPQPLQGLVDLILIRGGSQEGLDIAERVFEEFPFRAFLNEDGCFRASVEERYGVPAYGLLTYEEELNSAVQDELKKNFELYRSLEPSEQAVCARLRVVYRDVRSGEDSIVVAVLPENLLNIRVYDLLCPQNLAQEMVNGIGIVVLNPPKREENREYAKGRRAEDVPELQQFADELSKQQKKE